MSITRNLALPLAAAFSFSAATLPSTAEAHGPHHHHNHHNHHHNHGARGHFNPWPWVAGTVVLGAIAHERREVAPPQPVIIIREQEPVYVPDYAQSAQPAPRVENYVCLPASNECTPRTGTVNINNFNCPRTTTRAGQDVAVCGQTIYVFNPR